MLAYIKHVFTLLTKIGVFTGPGRCKVFYLRQQKASYKFER